MTLIYPSKCLCCHPPRENDRYVVTVRFPGSTKGYSYFSPRSFEPDDTLVVIVMGERKRVQVTSVRTSDPGDRLKTIYGTFKIRSDMPDTPRTPATTTENAMNIKITNKTYVNGTDIKELNDGEILQMLRDADKQIATLSELTPVPKRFQKKIDELKAGKEALLNLLDEVDAE